MILSVILGRGVKKYIVMDLWIGVVGQVVCMFLLRFRGLGLFGVLEVLIFVRGGFIISLCLVIVGIVNWLVWFEQIRLDPPFFSVLVINL